MTSPFTFHQRQPVSDATRTAPQVNFVQSLICDAKAVFADRMPTNSLAVGTFKYNFVSPRGSVLNPTGGHFGDGEGNFLAYFFFFTGAFLTGAFLVTLAFGVGVAFLVVLTFGVGVGVLVAATVEVSDSPRNKTVATETNLSLIDRAPI
jgi:hypothetical protein